MEFIFLYLRHSKAIQMFSQEPEELLSEHETSEETDLRWSYLLSGCKWAKATRPLNLFSSLTRWEYRNDPSGFPSNFLQSTHVGYWTLWAIAPSICKTLITKYSKSLQKSNINWVQLPLQLPNIIVTFVKEETLAIIKDKYCSTGINESQLPSKEDSFFS